ncbi:MAG TPA: HD domain-containing protein [Rhodocyclaceae bacterium]|nr:HD domain-containing protein [Rhodocyclaceae bacterium]
MSSPHHPLDLTGSVRLDSVAAVAGAVVDLLARRFPADELNPSFLRRAFDDIEAAFWGEYPACLPCDTPYHDLRHSLDTALLVARMCDGYQAVHGGVAARLHGREAELAVLLALFHDIGFLRRPAEKHLHGAQLTRQHENRSVLFVRAYLASSPLADYAASAELIHATNFAHAAADVLHGHVAQQQVIARMLGSADLISQLADRYYLERCRDCLYAEFVLAGLDRSTDAAGPEVVVYRDGEDLLRQTPAFYEQVIRKRLEVDFGNIQQVLDTHFGERNPYAASMAGNLAYLRRLIAENRLREGLRRRPRALIPNGSGR